MSPSHHDQSLLSRRQRLGLGVVVVALLAVLAARQLARPVHLSDPLPPKSDRADELSGRIDPNSADWPSLAALPSIGPSLARRIVEDREQFIARRPAGIPYRTIDDLLRIKGVGPATLKNLEPYLSFPDPNDPKTRPARSGE